MFSQLTGQPLDERFSLFPPFYTDYGKDIHIGKQVFINMGCKFQDQGGRAQGGENHPTRQDHRVLQGIPDLR